MTTSIDFYFDFGSPTAYLAFRRLQQLQSQYQFRINYRPVLLGGLFKATGNSSPVMVTAKAAYMMKQDLPRFVALYNVPFNNNSHFPINTLHLMRGAVALLEQDQFNAYIQVVFEAIWVNGENMGDAETVAKVLTGAGLDAQRIIANTQEPEVKATLINYTEAAVARGCFGAPTMFIGDDMFFGQDRMQFIEMALQ
jgi:2-hydroxychromene-2-carboxylate isomerase